MTCISVIILFVLCIIYEKTHTLHGTYTITNTEQTIAVPPPPTVPGVVIETYNLSSSAHTAQAIPIGGKLTISSTAAGSTTDATTGEPTFGNTLVLTKKDDPSNRDPVIVTFDAKEYCLQDWEKEVNKQLNPKGIHARMIVPYAAAAPGQTPAPLPLPASCGTLPPLPAGQAYPAGTPQIRKVLFTQTGDTYRELGAAGTTCWEALGLRENTPIQFEEQPAATGTPVPAGTPPTLSAAAPGKPVYAAHAPFQCHRPPSAPTPMPMVKYMYGYNSGGVQGALHNQITLKGPASLQPPCTRTPCPTRAPGACTLSPATVSEIVDGNNVIGCCVIRDGDEADYVQAVVKPKAYQPRALVAAVNRALACAGVPLCMTHRCRPGTLDPSTQQCQPDAAGCAATCTGAPATTTGAPAADRTLVSLSPMFVLKSSACSIKQIIIGGSPMFHTMRAPLGMAAYRNSATYTPAALDATAPPAQIKQRAVQYAKNDQSALSVTEARKYAVAPFTVQQDNSNVCARMNNAGVKTQMANSVSTQLNAVSATQCQIFSCHVDAKNDIKYPYQVGDIIDLYFYDGPTSPPKAYREEWMTHWVATTTQTMHKGLEIGTYTCGGLAAVGVILMLAGWFRHRKAKKEGKAEGEKAPGS